MQQESALDMHTDINRSMSAGLLFAGGLTWMSRVVVRGAKAASDKLMAIPEC